MVVLGVGTWLSTTDRYHRCTGTGPPVNHVVNRLNFLGNRIHWFLTFYEPLATS